MVGNLADATHEEFLRRAGNVMHASLGSSIDKKVLEEVGNVMHKEDTEDEEMVKQVGRMVMIVIIMCPVRLGA